MIIKEGFIKRKVKNKYIVIAIGNAKKEYKNYIELNQTASLIWDYISIGKTITEITNIFVQEYKIDFEKAFSDIKKITDELLKEGVIRE